MTIGLQVALTLWLTSLTVATEDPDYCKMCPKQRSHTMCKYPESGAVSPCLSYPIFDDKEIDTVSLFRVMSFHNDLRTKVAQGKSRFKLPQAANMYVLLWEPEAATIAQRWADQCNLSLDECRDSYDNAANFKPYAQSIGQYEAPASTNDSTFLVKIMDSWLKEGEKFQADQIASYMYSEGTENFTHMIWGEAYFIGCGRVEIPNNATGTKTVRLFCNYGPNVSEPNKPLYKRGKPRSACKAEQSISEGAPSSLCLARSVYPRGLNSGGTARVTYSALHLEILITFWFIVIIPE